MLWDCRICKGGIFFYFDQVNGFSFINMTKMAVSKGIPKSKESIRVDSLQTPPNYLYNKELFVCTRGK